MPALAADEATLSELLEVLGEPLKEKDLWAVLTGSCLALSDNLISGPLRDGVHFVTPHTLVLCREGTVRFAVKTYVREDPRCTPPESYSMEKVRISGTEVEKMLMYSLGVVIYIASTFMEKDTRASLRLSKDLEALLVGMCEDDPGRRLSLKEVLPVSHFFCNMDDSAARISALVKIIVGNILPLNKGKPSHVIHDLARAAPSREFSEPRRLPALRSVRSLDALESQQGLSETNSPRRGVLKHTNSHPDSLGNSGASDTSLSWRSFNGKIRGQEERSDRNETSLTLEGSLTDFNALMDLEQRKMREQGFLCESEVRSSYDTGNNTFVENGSPGTHRSVLKNGRGAGSLVTNRSSQVRQAGTDNKVPSRKGARPHSISNASLGETGSLANSDYSSTMSLNFGTYNMDISSDKWPSRSNSIGSRSRVSEDVQSLASSKLRSSTRNRDESGPEFYLITSDIGKSVVDITPPLLGPSPKGQRPLTVILPNLQRLEALLPMTSKVKGVMDLVAQHLLLKEASYFGLAQVRDGEHCFLEPDSKLVKHAPPGWKDASRKTDFILWFKVQFFIENLAYLRHFTTRHLHYLQLRGDLLKDYTHCEEDKALQLAGLALQAEYGDYDANYHRKNYFQTEHYLPARIINRLQRNEIVTRLLDSHTAYRGLSQDQAESQFLRECQRLPEYGVLFHRVSRSKKEEEDDVLLGICVNGILVYEIKGSMKIPIHKQPWSLTKEFSFRGKRFSIKPVKDMYAPKMTFFANQDKKSKYLLSVCKAFHRFHAFNNLRKYGNHPSLESSFNQGDNVVEQGSRPSSQPSSIEDKSYAKTTANQKRSQREVEEDTVTEKAVAVTSSERAKRQLSVHGSSDEELDPLPNPRRRLSTLDCVPDRKILIVRLLKEKDQGLGITIVGGEDSRSLNQGIYIKTITPGGVVARDGRLQRGDRILAVNNTSLESVTHDEAVDILKKVAGKCEIIVSQIQSGDSALDSAGLCSSDFGHEVVEPDVLEEKFLGNLRVVHPPSLRQKDEKLNSENVFADDAADETDFICEESPYASVAVAEQKPSTISMASAAETEAIGPRLQLELTKKAGSLGFIITGGRDSSVPGGHVIISELIPGGAAELNGNIKLGDKIVEVNGISLEDVYHKQAVEILKRAPMKTRLVLKRPADPTVFLSQDNSTVRPHDAVILSGTDMMDGPECASVESNTYSVLLKKKNGGLGLSITGGLGSSPGFEDRIFVRKMFPGQPADSSKKIKVGDVILHVNGEDVTGRSKAEVVQILRNATCPVMLRLQRTEPYEMPREILDETASPPTTPDQILAKVQTKIQHITKQYSVPLSVEQKNANVEALYATVNKEKKTNRKANVTKQLSEGAASAQSPRQLSPLAVVMSAKANYTSEDPTCRSKYTIRVKSSPCAQRRVISNEGLSSPEAIEEPETSDIIFQSPSDLDDDSSNDGEGIANTRGSSLPSKDWKDLPVAHGISDEIELDSPYASIGSPVRKEENVTEKRGLKAGPGRISKPTVHEEPTLASVQNELSTSQEDTLNMKTLERNPDVPETLQSSQLRSQEQGYSTCPEAEPPYTTITALRLPTPEPSPKRQEATPEEMLVSSHKNAFDDTTPLRLPTTAGLASSYGKDSKFPIRPSSVDETGSIPRVEGDGAHELRIERNVSSKESDIKFRTIDVTLERSPSGLGFTVAGGFSTTGGCFIREVVADPALSKGSIKSGDQLVQVNGQDVTKLDHADAIEVLRNCGRYVHLVLRRKRFRGSRRRMGKNTRSVILTRNSRGRFGLLLGEEAGYIIVQDLVPNEPADRDGGLRHGDRILEINDQTTFSLSLQEARELMNSSGPQLYLVVEKTKHDIESRYHVPEGSGSFQSSVDEEQDTEPSKPQAPKESLKPDAETESPTLDAVNSLLPTEAMMERPTSSDSEVSFSSIGSPVLKRLDCRSDQNLADVSWISSSAEEKGHIICVQIEKGPSGLGMSLETKEVENGDTGVFIKSLDIKGTASKNGQLRPGDRLIGINGRNVEHMNQLDIISFMRSIPSVASLEVFRMPRNVSFRKRNTQVLSSRPVSVPSGGFGTRAVSLETPSVKEEKRMDRSRSFEELEHFSSRDVATAIPLNLTDLALSPDKPASSIKSNFEKKTSNISPDSNAPLNFRPNIEEEQSTTSFGNTEQKLKLHRQDSLDQDMNPDHSNFTEFVLQSEGIVLPDGMELADLNIPIEISKSDYTGSDVASELSAVSSASKRSEERVHNLINQLPVSDNRGGSLLYELGDVRDVKDDHGIIETSFARDSSASGSDAPIPSRELSPSGSTGFSSIDRGGSTTSGNPGTSPLSDVDSSVKGGGQSHADLDSLAHQLRAKLKSKKVDSEYQEIRKMKSWGTSRVGKRAYNKNKNRPKAPIPYDENRVCLTGGEEVDYINASLVKVDAEGQSYNFIAAQGPLNNTYEDFWKMVFENRVEIIVMVTNDVENGKNKCHRYWPEIPGLPMKVLDRWSIEIANVTQRGNAVMRELIAKNSKTGKSVGLLHCWYKTLPEGLGLKNMRSFVQFVGDVVKIELTGPVVVHCSGGGERTGAFILAYVIYQTLLAGGLPNISHFAKKIAKQRSGLVQSKEQYQLFYKLAVEIVDMLNETT